MEAIAPVQSAALNPVVAQAIALVTHANAYLRGNSNEPVELVGSHSSFRTTYEVTFDRLGPGDRPFPLADGTAPWYRRLQKEEITRMRLVLYPWEEERAVRVAGLPEPRWGLVTEGDVGMEMWAPDWTIRPGINPKLEPAPWRVSWQAEKCVRGVVRGDRELSEAGEDLKSAIQGIAAIIRATGDELEKGTFESLVEALESGRDCIVLGQFPDIFEADLYDDRARWLGLNSALAIGMYVSAGWFHRRFDSETLQRAFEQARSRVWSAALTGIQSAVNTLAA